MESLFVFNQTELYLAGATTLLFVIQVMYYLITYARPVRLARRGQAEAAVACPPVSVIVYAKNESENLRNHLPDLLTQDYPVYEVIVINDGSTDESDQVLKMYKQEYNHLYHTYIPEDARYLSRKKLALTVGIKAAKYDCLLFTEANCRPLTDRWIASMMQGYRDDHTDIVLGFCAYRRTKGFHKLVAYDNLIGGLQYLSPALKHRPYTGNGRNLSYSKRLFYEHKGYYRSLNLHAGDDDLFINETATGANTQTEYTPDSLMEMAPVERFGVWKEMKVSKAATQQYYKGGRLTFYRMENACFFLFLAAVVLSVAIGLQGNWLIAVWAGLLAVSRLIVKGSIIYKAARLLAQKPLIGWMPLLELFLPVFNLYVRIYRIFRGKNDYTFRLGNIR